MFPKLPPNTTLLVIDVQRGFDDMKWGPRNNPEAELKIARAIACFRDSERPIIHVRHDSTEPNSPLRPGQDGNRFKDEATPLPGETVIAKTVNSAFIGTDLERRLRDARVTTVVICGLTTNHCISTTARMAGNLGFQTYVLSDGTATFDTRSPNGRMISAEQMHELGLTEIHGEFAEVIETEQLVLKL
jgi:nicotinamidase-related amidase